MAMDLRESSISLRILLFIVLCCMGISSCSGDPHSISILPQSQRPLLNADNPLVTPTYDGSGQATEPSVRVFPIAWHGFTAWMVVAPYPNSDNSKENPSILASNDALNWIVPPGLTNPLAFPPFGHFADSELFYDASSDQLWVYFGWENSASSSSVLRMTSSDGVNWSSQQMLFQLPDYQWTSPTVQKAGNTYYMWTVNAGPVGCSGSTTSLEYRTSQDGVGWSQPQTTDLSQPGYVIWHPEVTWVEAKHEFWMLFAAYANGGNCGNTVLFFAKSTDGIHWATYNKPALGTGQGWDAGEIYRAGMAYDPAKALLQVWYSARSGSDWHVGYTEAIYNQFLERLQQ